MKTLVRLIWAAMWAAVAVGVAALAARYEHRMQAVREAPAKNPPCTVCGESCGCHEPVYNGNCGCFKNP